jgi:hypothetical protein
MVHQIGDLGILIDYGENKPGSVLQHNVLEGPSFVWQAYTINGKPVTEPIDVKSLPPGEYRLV